MPVSGAFCLFRGISPACLLRVIAPVLIYFFINVQIKLVDILFIYFRFQFMLLNGLTQNSPLIHNFLQTTACRLHNSWLG